MVNDTDSVPSSGFCDSGERLVQFVLRDSREGKNRWCEEA